MHFKEMAEYFNQIEETASRLEMTVMLAELLGKVQAREVRKAIYLMQGKLAPNYESIEIGLGEKYVEDAIAQATGYGREEVHKAFQKEGDLGFVAELFLEKKKQKSLFSAPLTIDKVFKNYERIATIEGKGSQDTKIKLMAELFNSASPKEAKYIARIPIGNLRLGIGDPTIMDAFATVYLKEYREKHVEIEKKITENVKSKKEEERKIEIERKLRSKIREDIEAVYNIYSDLGGVAEHLKEKGLQGLKGLKITPGIPIRPTLAERLNTVEEILEKLEGKAFVEAKYDGFRLQVHKHKDKVWLFSRNQENMTSMFPEIVNAVKKHVKAESCILEGEAIAFEEESQEYYSFQVTITRKRKYGVEEAAKELPLQMFFFDIMYKDGEDIMPESFQERRKLLESIIPNEHGLHVTNAVIAETAEEIDAFFNTSIEAGLEGIIAKDLHAKYSAGARKFAWIKLKRSYKGELQDTVDVVIVGYFKGKGKRTQFGLGALLTAVYAPKEDVFKSIAKIGTGISEDQLKELKALLSKITSTKKPARLECDLTPDNWVIPKYVIEVRADEITKSPMHTCGRRDKQGYALRFPRMISFREKKPEQATTEKEIIDMFKKQKTIKIEER